MEMEPYLPFEDISLEALSQPLKGRTRIQVNDAAIQCWFGWDLGGIFVFQAL